MTKYEVRQDSEYFTEGHVLCTYSDKETALIRRNEAQEASDQMEAKYGPDVWSHKTFRVFEVTEIA